MTIKTLFLKLCIIFLLLLSLPAYCQSERFAVQDTFNDSPFEYELKLLEQRDLHKVYAISFPSPLTTAFESNNTVHGEFFLPNDVPEGTTLPAVLINHILAGGFDLERMMCTTLANQGVAAMFIMMPHYGLRGKHLNPRGILESAERFISSMHQGVQDNRRAIDIFISRPEVAADRIGIAGGSMGSIISACVCGFEPRIERAFLLLSGGNLEKIFQNPCRETEPFRNLLQKLTEEQRVATLQELKRFDPLTQQEALQRLSGNGKLKMICAAEDEVIPPSCSRELGAAARCEIIWLPGVNHYTVFSQSGFITAELIDFFASNPSLTWKPSANNEKVDDRIMGLRLLSGFFRDLHSLLGGVPAEGCAHHMAMTLQLAAEHNKFNAEMRLSKGGEGHYKIFADIPKLGRGQIGQDEFPWLAGANDSLLIGSQNAIPGHNCSTFISPELLMKYQMVLGILATGALAPEMLKQVAEWTVVREAGNKTGIAVSINHAQFKGRLYLLFTQNGQPESGHFHIKNIMLSFNFSDWRLNAPTPATFFSPPENLQSQAVNQQDVFRIFAAIFERLLESIN
ncbi:MAG: hypothetical protein GX946_12480 [Oligosphaeraceae bacterium]|nr:hypothetical protein [Oligosphaeraceae bacterium]